MKLILLTIFFITNAHYCFAYSQLSAEDANVIVGNEFEINFFENNIDSTNDIIELSFDIKLSNPTVAYLLEIAEKENTLIKPSLIRENDSLYKVSLKINNTSTQKLNNIFSIKAFALAGNDTITYLNFSNIIINGKVSDDFEIKIISKSIEGAIIYLRKPTIRAVYPNPVNSNSSIYCTFSIDEELDIEFVLYDLSGRAFKSLSLDKVQKGTSIIEFPLDYQYSMGTYYLMMKTIENNDTRKIIIIK